MSNGSEPCFARPCGHISRRVVHSFHVLRSSQHSLLLCPPPILRRPCFAFMNATAEADSRFEMRLAGGDLLTLSPSHDCALSPSRRSQGAACYFAAAMFSAPQWSRVCVCACVSPPGQLCATVRATTKKNEPRGAEVGFSRRYGGVNLKGRAPVDECQIHKKVPLI